MKDLFDILGRDSVSVNPIIYRDSFVAQLKQELAELDERLKKLEAWVAERKQQESDGK